MHSQNQLTTEMDVMGERYRKIWVLDKFGRELLYRYSTLDIYYFIHAT